MLNTLQVSKVSATLALSLAVLSSITFPFSSKAQTQPSDIPQPFEQPADYQWSISSEPIPVLTGDRSLLPSDADALLALIDQAQVKPTPEFASVPSLNQFFPTSELISKDYKTTDSMKP